MSKDIQWLKWCIYGAALYSTCDKRQYMSIIIDNYGHVVGTGYNGAPKGMRHCNDGACPRLYENSENGSSYSNCIAIHAEQNALLHSDYTSRRDGGTLYVNGPPCFTCAKLIANSGVNKLVYLADPAYKDFISVKIFLIEAGIDLIEYTKDDIDRAVVI